MWWAVGMSRTKPQLVARVGPVVTPRAPPYKEGESVVPVSKRRVPDHKCVYMERGGEVPEHNCMYMTYGERRRGKEKEELEVMCEEGV